MQEFFGLLLQSALGNKPATLGPNEWVAGVEASLDIEYIMSTGQSVPTLFWSNGGLTKGQEPFLKWMLALGQMKSPPLVISVSYGDDENSLSPQYMHRVETEFQKAVRPCYFKKSCPFSHCARVALIRVVGAVLLFSHFLRLSGCAWCFDSLCKRRFRSRRILHGLQALRSELPRLSALRDGGGRHGHEWLL